MDPAWTAHLAASRRDLLDRRLLRALRPLAPSGPLRARLGEREVTLFCSNDYLGLSAHPAVRRAAAEAAASAGMGPRGSPLVCGYTVEHEALERDLARLASAEAALLFPTGYAANLSVLSALGGPGVTILSDARNHASIVEGCRMARLAGASVAVYEHADAPHAESLLEGCRTPRRLVVTDAVFSMDGDVAPLPELAAAARRHGALLVVDEAHALLVLGPRGGGAATALGVRGEVDVLVGTLGKAIGAQGGFVAASREIVEHVLNRGRPYVYSTAPVLPVVAAARAALRVFGEEPALVERLRAHVATLGRARGRGFPAAIVPVVLGDEEAALAASAALLEDGLLVPAMRPPTVPPGTSRLRVTLSASHADEDVARLAAALARLGSR